MERELANSYRSQRERTSLAQIMGISVLKRIQSLQHVPLPVLLCMHIGTKPPAYCAKMPRNPNPITGQRLVELPDIITDVLNYNPALHDGAILVRITGDNDYIISGWSYRLFPPSISYRAIENRGSAYNSSIAMSAVKNVELVLVLSSKGIVAFANGSEIDLE